MMPIRLMALLIAVAVVYTSAYFGLRATHRITHFSNANHWHHEKRFPGHFVGVAHDRAWLVEWTFKPLMLAEQAFHNTRG